MTDEGDEIKKLLKRNIQIAEENNRMIRSMHSSMQWGRFFRILYWIVIIGFAIGAFYFLQPVIDSFGDTIKSFSSNLETLEEAGGHVREKSSFFFFESDGAE